MFKSPMTDYAQAVRLARGNPGHTVHFEGTLPCGSVAKQDITHVKSRPSLDSFIAACTGKFIVIHGNAGFTLVDTREQDNKVCQPGWIKAGNSLRESRPTSQAIQPQAL